MKFPLLILFTICFFQCQNSGTGASELQQIASDFNKKGARMIDAETKIESIEIKGNNTIVYKYTLINLLAKNVDTIEFKKLLKPGIISVIKLSPEMKKLRDQNTQFEYYYKDKEQKFIYNFVIQAKDYN